MRLPRWLARGVLLLIVGVGCASDPAADAPSVPTGVGSTIDVVTSAPLSTIRVPDAAAATIPQSSLVVAVPSTTVTTAAPATSLVASEPALFGSLERLLVLFSASSEVVAADGGGDVYALGLDDVVVGDVDGFDAGFAATGFFDAGIMTGTLDADGAVTSVGLLFDPDGPSAAGVLTTLLASTLGSTTGFDLNGFAGPYQGLVAEASSSPGAQLWLANTAGTNHSLVVTVVEGAVVGDPLIEVAIVPVADEAAAKAAVGVVRPLLLGLVGG